MARKLDPYWQKLKKEKSISIEMKPRDDITDAQLIDAAEKVRTDLARCKSEDMFYKTDFPHAKIRMTVKTRTILLFELDENVYLAGSRDITLEDL